MNKKLFIAGNWKSNKTLTEAKAWMEQYERVSSDATVVLCVPYTLLSYFHDTFSKIGTQWQLGAQNISPYDNGAFTGEVSASQVREFAQWVIIGHSERRKYFGETDAILEQKVARATEKGLNVIYCVPDQHTSVPNGVNVVAYEPVWAIGTGKTDTPENANNVIQIIKQSHSVATCIYGGSVTESNVREFVAMDAIDGVLPGGASLDPKKFQALIRAAS